MNRIYEIENGDIYFEGKQGLAFGIRSSLTGLSPDALKVFLIVSHAYHS